MPDHTVDRYAPRAEAGGRFERACENPKCPHGHNFRTDNAAARYCTETCKKAAQNHANYLRNRDERIRRASQNRQRRQG